MLPVVGASAYSTLCFNDLGKCCTGSLTRPWSAEQICRTCKKPAYPDHENITELSKLTLGE